MNEEDLKKIEWCINHHKSFMIGRRGAAIKFTYGGFKWFGYQPRSYMTLCFSILKVNGQTLSGESPGWCPMKVDLEEYSKFTRLHEGD